MGLKKLEEIAIQASPFIIIGIGAIISAVAYKAGNYLLSVNAALFSSGIGLGVSAYVTRERKDNGDNYPETQH